MAEVVITPKGSNASGTGGSMKVSIQTPQGAKLGAEGLRNKLKKDGNA